MRTVAGAPSTTPVHRGELGHVGPQPRRRARGPLRTVHAHHGDGAGGGGRRRSRGRPAGELVDGVEADVEQGPQQLGERLGGPDDVAAQTADVERSVPVDGCRRRPLPAAGGRNQVDLGQLTAESRELAGDAQRRLDGLALDVVEQPRGARRDRVAPMVGPVRRSSDQSQVSGPSTRSHSGRPSTAAAAWMPEMTAASMHPALRPQSVQSPASTRLSTPDPSTRSRWRSEPGSDCT